MGTTIHGRGGKVFLEGSASWAVPLGEAKSWEFDIDQELEEIESMGGDWMEFSPGYLRFSGSIKGNMDLAQATPFDAVKINRVVPSKFYLYPDYANNAGRYYYGSLWPKLHVSVGTEGTASFVLDFEGHGELGTN